MCFQDKNPGKKGFTTAENKFWLELLKSDKSLLSFHATVS